MKKEFLINLILLVAINLLVKVSYLFFIEVEVQNTLGPESYGLYLALFNFTYLFQFINDPGIHSYNITEIAREKEKFSYHLPRIIGTKMVFGLIFLLIVSVCAWMIGYDTAVFPFLLIVAINHIFITYYQYLKSNLSAIGRYKTESLISAIDKLLMLMIIGFSLFYLKDFSLYHFLLGQTVSYIISIVIIIALISRDIKIKWPRFSFIYTKKLLGRSLPFALILLLMASYNRMDGVMIERMLENGEYQAGIYAASFRYMEASNMLVYLVAALLLPMFSSSINNKGIIAELCNVGIRIVVVICVSISVTGIVFREEWMSIYTVYDPQYPTLLLFHLLSFCCIGVSYVYGTLITASRKLKAFNLLLLSGVIINLSLNLLLIPKLQAQGAAVATLVTQFFVMLGQVFLAFRIFSLSANAILILKGIGYIIATLLLTLFIKEFLAFSWVIKTVISGIISIFLAFLLDILRKDMIFALFK